MIFREQWLVQRKGRIASTLVQSIVISGNEDATAKRILSPCDISFFLFYHIQNVDHCNSMLYFSALLHFILWSFSKRCFSREKYKVYIEHLSLAHKHIVLKKLFKLARTDLCSFKRELLELNERSCKICMDIPSDTVS